MRKSYPAGIKLLRYFYLLTALSLILSFILGRELTDVVCLGQRLCRGWASAVMAVLMLLPLFLFWGFRQPDRLTWRLAVGYHFFFVLNSLLGLFFVLNTDFLLKPIIRITGKNYLGANDILTTQAAFGLFIVFNLNLLLGVAIIWYLWQRRDYFFEGS